MRKKLESAVEVRKKFHAVFSRFGRKTNFSGYSGETILLTDVRDALTGELLTDHVWFALTKGFLGAGLRPGVKVEFEARVRQYQKGYVNRKYNIDQRRRDYKLTHPTRIKIINGA